MCPLYELSLKFNLVKNVNSLEMSDIKSFHDINKCTSTVCSFAKDPKATSTTN